MECVCKCVYVSVCVCMCAYVWYVSMDGMVVREGVANTVHIRGVICVCVCVCSGGVVVTDTSYLLGHSLDAIYGQNGTKPEPGTESFI